MISLSDEEKERIKKQIEEEDRQIAKRAVEGHERNRMRKVFSDSLINPLLEKATFDTYIPKNEGAERAKQLCQRYAQNFDINNPVNLLLVGNYGTGKSHLAVSAMKKMSIKNVTMPNGEIRNMSMLFIFIPKLMTIIKDTYNSTSDNTEARILNEIAKVDLLVMDDLGAEIKANNNDFAISKISEVVDSRQGKHTIYTTNYSENDLLNMYGERVFSRIMQDTHKISFEWENYRLRNMRGAN